MESNGVYYQVAVEVSFNCYFDDTISEDESIPNQILSTAYLDGSITEKIANEASVKIIAKQS